MPITAIGTRNTKNTDRASMIARLSRLRAAAYSAFAWFGRGAYNTLEREDRTVRVCS
ncbi:hypothetical protein W02_42430 [Nitrospira sp. KM1]|nr:hypothetical protein W02_42430 [Nitrospira sp. KM1]